MHSDLIADLKNTLAEDRWHQVISALRQDALIWDALQDTTFRKSAVQHLGSQPESWSPAKLISLKLKLDPDTAIEQILPDIIEKAENAYLDVQRINHVGSDLMQAGLIALALYKRAADWSSLPLDIPWSTALACLFGWLPNTSSFISSLSLPHVIHVILANPIHHSQQLDLLTTRLTMVSPDELQASLKVIRAQRPNLAMDLAGKFLNHTKNNRPKTLRQKLAQSQFNANNQALSNAFDDARLSFDKVIETAAHIKINAVLGAAQMDILGGQPDRALDRWQQYKTDSYPEQNAQLALAFMEHGYFEHADALLPAVPPDNQLIVQIAVARLRAHQKDYKSSRQILKHGLNSAASLKTSLQDHWHQLLAALIEVGLYGEIIRLATAYLQKFPNDIRTLQALSQAHQIAGALNDALSYGNLAVALQPQDIDLRRTLAEGLEADGLWDAAFIERERIIKNNIEPLSIDFYKLANCALQIGDAQQTIDISQQALLHDPEDGLAHTISGKALLTLGNRQDAHQQFELAIQFSPELPDPWLVIAQDQIKSNENKAALKTLKTAARAVPNSPQIHLLLGDIYQAQSASTKALNVYRRAADLTKPARGNAVQAALNAQISYALGKALLELGHTLEARQSYRNAHNAMPAQPAIAHAYGQLLIEGGKPGDALNPLALAKTNDPQNAAVYIDYAQAHLLVGEQPGEAENALKQLLVFDPNHFQAKALLAEALESGGKNVSALDAYNLALSVDSDQSAAWRQRLILGKGRVALILNQAETALTALKEAWEFSPQDLTTTKMLAEAYKLNNLPQKALHTAKAALNLAPYDIDMLLWYTSLMDALGFNSNAITALDHAITKQPHHAKLYLLHGQLQLKGNEPIAAQRSFAKLVTIETATPEQLKTAADGLIASQDPTNAIACLVRAIEISKINLGSPDDLKIDKNFNFEVLTQLANTYSTLGSYQLAIDAIDHALDFRPNHPNFMYQKGFLLCKLGHKQAALAWNHAAIKKLPDNPYLQIQAAQIQRLLGNLSTSLEVANKAYLLSQQCQDQSCSLAAVTMVADLYIALMSNDQARELLAQYPDLDSSSRTDATINFYCIQGELAIHNNDETAAENALAKALNLNDQHPRVLALHARVKRRQGELGPGKVALNTALKLFGQENSKSNLANNTHIALADAALEFQAWSTAIFLLEEALQIAPEEPLAYTLLAGALVQQAEYQNLFNTLNISRHAPGDSALSKESYQRYDQAVLTASRLIEALHNTELHTTLSTYLVRGQAIFHPSAEHAEALLDFAPTADNMAAYLGSLRSSGHANKAAEAALELYQHVDTPNEPFLSGQIALALIRKSPEFAAVAAQNSVNESLQSHIPNHALFLALQAYVAHRVHDHSTQLKAVQALLKHWDTEPYWQAQAAESLINQGDLLGADALQQAEAHLQKAVHLAPLDSSYHLKLGKLYLRMNEFKGAITTLQKAVQLDPDSIQSRITLAEAVQISGNNHQAKQIAKEISHLAPEEPAAYLLLAKIALQEKQAENALNYAQKILQTDPQNPEALLTKSEALTELRKYTKALAAFESALKHMPESAVLRLQHANLTQRVHGTQATLKILQTYHKQYPDDIPLKIRLGNAFADNGNKAAAIKLAQQTLQLGELLTKEQFSQTQILLAVLLRQSGQLDQAITHLNSAIDHNPDWAAPHLELGRTYQQRRQYDRALNAYHRAIALDPTNPQPYHWAGIVLKDSKDYVNAEMMLRKAANFAPKDIGIQRKLAAMIALNLVHHTKTSNVPTTIR